MPFLPLGIVGEHVGAPQPPGVAGRADQAPDDGRPLTEERHGDRSEVDSPAAAPGCAIFRSADLLEERARVVPCAHGVSSADDRGGSSPPPPAVFASSGARPSVSRSRSRGT